MSMKRKLEEQRKKEEEERLAAVHKDFLDSFSDAPKLDKAWVKAGTAETERRGDNVKREIYKPKSKLAELAGSFKSHHSQSRDEHSSPKPSLKKPQRESKKSNLEIFKEELKAMQEERDERRKLRTHIKDCEDQGIAPTLLTSSGKPSRFEADHSTIRSIEKSLETDIYGSMSSGSKSSAYENDHTTTNVYCGNIAPKMSEQDLCEVFGKYGPLASIKIMYPRSEEERAKNRHTGFVGFMKRSDAEDAFDGLKGETIMGYEMRLSWGKPIPIPPRPIYIPPSMIKETQPPPPSGLPFNAQPLPDWHPDIDRFGNQDVTKNLDSTEVKIVIPTDRLLLCLIHRMVEYVIREGPLFEAMIMNKEMNNPRFRFLFDNQTPAHTYYRWKLYSILQGDEPHVWNTKPFQMFVGGSYWLPPKMNPYMQKQVTKETSKQSTAVTSSDRKRTALSDRQCERLGDILRELTADRVKVGEAMIWCLEHAEASQEIVEILKDALTIGDTAQQKKLARLYVVSDVLYNSSAKLPYVSNFRKFFEPMLPDVFKSFNDTYMSIEGRMQAEHFKQKIMSCFRTWDEWVIYPPDHLIKCQNIFLGLMEPGEAEEVEEDVDGAPLSPAADADIDGEPLNDTTNIDGEPLRAKSNGRRRVQEDDIDGIPVDDDDDIDGAPLNKSNNSTTSANLSALDSKPKFAASKWETVDEEVVKAQAMTTSKWEQLEEPAAGDQGSYRRSYDHSPASDDLDGQPIDSRGSSPIDDNDLSKGGMSGLASLSAAYTPNEKRAKLEMTEKRRTKLRDIEMKVVKYQDELEAGRRSRKPRMSIGQQVEAYRQKLLNKEREEAMREQSDESPYRSDSRSERKKRYADKSRSPSPRGGRRTSRRSRSRSSSRSHSIRASRRSRSPRSRSPRRSKRSRSRSSDRYNRHKKNRH